MPYNPDTHHRRSIRLRGYDYAQQGLYFITLCVQNRVCMFGEAVKGEMRLNDAGRMIEKWWLELANKFPDIELLPYVVMPNHFHGIIYNNGKGNPNIQRKNVDMTVGAHLRVRPDDNGVRTDYNGINTDEKGASVGADLRVCPDDNGVRTDEKGASAGSPLQTTQRQREHVILGEHKNNILGEHTGSPLHNTVQWFKTMATNEYIRNVKTFGWQPFNKRLFQRNYYEHIIRDYDDYARIAEYIAENPANW